MLNRKEQEELYYQAIEVSDLVELIIDEVELDGEHNQELATELVEPVIKQMIKSADVVSETYLEWIENKQKRDKKLIKKMEAAIRDVFVSTTNFLNAVKKIQCKVSEDFVKLSNEITQHIDNVRRNIKNKEGLLPHIGNKAGQLIHGPIGNGFFEESEKSPIYSRIIRAVKDAMDHFFRITYCFFRLENGLVENPSNVIWGRTVPDIKAKAIIEKYNKDVQNNQVVGEAIIIDANKLGRTI